MPVQRIKTSETRTETSRGRCHTRRAVVAARRDSGWAQQLRSLSSSLRTPPPLLTYYLLTTPASDAAVEAVYQAMGRLLLAQTAVLEAFEHDDIYSASDAAIEAVREAMASSRAA